MKKRKQLINWLFENSQRIYLRFKKKEPWNITAAMLIAMPPESFGYHLGYFLKSHGFELIPKVERHDAYHLLTGFSTCVQDEIALQYLCFGNGKRTPYLLAVLCMGSLLLPEYFAYYRKAYTIGKASNSFHHFDFKTVLSVNFETFRSTIFSEEISGKLLDIQHQYSIQHSHLKTMHYGTK